MTIDTLATWHQLVANRDIGGPASLLADNAVFHSPVVHSPQVGYALTQRYLTAAFRVFFNESSHYILGAQFPALYYHHAGHGSHASP